MSWNVVMAVEHFKKLKAIWKQVHLAFQFNIGYNVMIKMHALLAIVLLDWCSFTLFSWKFLHYILLTLFSKI